MVTSALHTNKGCCFDYGDAGLFFEGFMTAGVTSKARDAAVQANIVAAGYGGLAQMPSS